ncbi:MAG: hypothetical protein AAF184_01020 [Pseudomonadota bacterium]
MAITIPSAFAQGAGAAIGQAGGDCQVGAILDFWGEEIAGQAVSGRSRLCAGERGLNATLEVTGLIPGHAYTAWWVYIDSPQACANFPLTTENSDVPFDEPFGYAGMCGLADFGTPDPVEDIVNPLAVFGRFDSAIAGDESRRFLRGTVRDFTPSPGSQVWVLVFGHGPANEADGRELARQLLTPEDPLAGIPHLGIEGRPFGYAAGVTVFELP